MHARPAGWLVLSLLLPLLPTASWSGDAAPAADQIQIEDPTLQVTCTLFAQRLPGPGVQRGHVDVHLRWTSPSFTAALGDLRIASITTRAGAALARDPGGRSSGVLSAEWPFTAPGSALTDPQPPNLFARGEGWQGMLAAADTLTIRGSIASLPLTELRWADLRPADLGVWLRLTGLPSPLRLALGPARVLAASLPEDDQRLVTGIFAFDGQGEPIPLQASQVDLDGTERYVLQGDAAHVQVQYADPVHDHRIPFQIVTRVQPQPSTQVSRFQAPMPLGAPMRELPSLSLEEFAQDDGTKPGAPAAPTLAPDAATLVYVHDLELVMAGEQAACEALLPTQRSTWPQDARLVFLQGCLTRSRFQVDDAAPLLREAIDLHVRPPRAQACALVLALDGHQDVSANLDRLTALVREHPEDVLLCWLLGIECRSAHATALGIWAYTLLQHRVSPGPVLFHQTFANLLDEAGRSPEALPHRLLAVALEEEPWTVSALGDTLSDLQRYDEAATAYARAVRLDHDDAENWGRWAHALALAGKDADAVAKAAHALNLEAANAEALLATALVAEHQHRIPDAIHILQQVLAQHADETWAATELQRLQSSGGITP